MKGMETTKPETPFEKRCCYDCGHLKSYVSWWCGSEEAKEYRGTAIPGCQHCKFWTPDWSHIDKKYHTPENGYVPDWFERLIEKLKSLF